MKFIGTNIERSIQRSMFDYGPKMYEEYLESVVIISTEALEMELLHSRIVDVLKQFNIFSSTWGLSSYEYDLGIKTDLQKPFDDRKSTVISKLRGAGTTSTELIKNVVESYANASVEVKEQNNIYNVHIVFVGTLGIPPNMNDLERALREILPAHMTYTLEFKYNLYNNFTHLPYSALSVTTYEDLLITEQFNLRR